ncbi:hypothetical protein O0L34_g6385 [Tuta absoluta]|nr:hypothetical protein O0L34_g6385 [Tuta absoluta]
MADAEFTFKIVRVVAAPIVNTDSSAVTEILDTSPNSISVKSSRNQVLKTSENQVPKSKFSTDTVETSNSQVSQENSSIDVTKKELLKNPISPAVEIRKTEGILQSSIPVEIKTKVAQDESPITIVERRHTRERPVSTVVEDRHTQIPKSRASWCYGTETAKPKAGIKFETRSWNERNVEVVELRGIQVGKSNVSADTVGESNNQVSQDNCTVVIKRTQVILPTMPTTFDNASKVQQDNSPISVVKEEHIQVGPVTAVDETKYTQVRRNRGSWCDGSETAKPKAGIKFIASSWKDRNVGDCSSPTSTIVEKRQTQALPNSLIVESSGTHVAKSNLSTDTVGERDIQVPIQNASIDKTRKKSIDAPVSATVLIKKTQVILPTMPTTFDNASKVPQDNSPISVVKEEHIQVGPVTAVDETKYTQVRRNRGSWCDGSETAKPKAGIKFIASSWKDRNVGDCSSPTATIVEKRQTQELTDSPIVESSGIQMVKSNSTDTVGESNTQVPIEYTSIDKTRRVSMDAPVFTTVVVKKTQVILPTVSTTFENKTKVPQDDSAISVVKDQHIEVVPVAAVDETKHTQVPINRGSWCSAPAQPNDAIKFEARSWKDRNAAESSIPTCTISETRKSSLTTDFPKVEIRKTKVVIESPIIANAEIKKTQNLRDSYLVETRKTEELIDSPAAQPLTDCSISTIVKTRQTHEPVDSHMSTIVEMRETQAPTNCLQSTIVETRQIQKLTDSHIIETINTQEIMDSPAIEIRKTHALLVSPTTEIRQEPGDLSVVETRQTQAPSNSPMSMFVETRQTQRLTDSPICETVETRKTQEKLDSPTVEIRKTHALLVSPTTEIRQTQKPVDLPLVEMRQTQAPSNSPMSMFVETRQTQGLTDSPICETVETRKTKEITDTPICETVETRTTQVLKDSPICETVETRTTREIPDSPICETVETRKTQELTETPICETVETRKTQDITDSPICETVETRKTQEITDYPICETVETRKTEELTDSPICETVETKTTQKLTDSPICETVEIRKTQDLMDSNVVEIRKTQNLTDSPILENSKTQHLMYTNVVETRKTQELTDSPICETVETRKTQEITECSILENSKTQHLIDTNVVEIRKTQNLTDSPIHENSKTQDIIDTNVVEIRKTKALTNSPMPTIVEMGETKMPQIRLSWSFLSDMKAWEDQRKRSKAHPAVARRIVSMGKYFIFFYKSMQPAFYLTYVT